VIFTPELRAETERLAARMHELYAAARTTLAIYEKKKCGNCSLIELCQPKLLGPQDRASRYFREALAAHLAGPASE
jgi:CRISPR-associated exonuclease Cas4